MATLNLGNGGGVMTVGGTVTIDDSTIADNDAARAGGGIENNAGMVTLTDVTLGGPLVADGNTAGVNGGGLHVSGAGTTNINGGTVQNNVATQEGGGLWNSGTGTMTIAASGMGGTLIDSNTANGDDAATAQGGGGVFNVGGTLSITDATISNNVSTATLANNGGGGVLVEGGANNTITDTTISGNTADTAGTADGGGILVANGATLDVIRGTISGNSANRAGGGIENNASIVTLTDVTLGGPLVADGNTAGVNGGGLHVSGAGTTNINGGIVQNNVAGQEGGGLWNGTGVMTISDTSGDVLIDNNTASGDGTDQGGGGIFNAGGTVVIQDNDMTNTVTISNNRANGTSGSGGGILNDASGTLTVTGAVIDSNSANRAGGGIEATAGTTNTLTNVSLTNNDVDGGAGTANPGNGGGLHITGNGNVLIDGGTITGNDAAAEGGGLWNGTGVMTISDTSGDVLIDNNTASGDGADQGGGGIFNAGGTVVIQDNDMTNTVTISNNRANPMSRTSLAPSEGSGGGILSDGGTLNVTSVIFTDNNLYDVHFIMASGRLIDSTFDAAAVMPPHNENVAYTGTDNVDVIDVSGSAIRVETAPVATSHPSVVNPDVDDATVFDESVDIDAGVNSLVIHALLGDDVIHVLQTTTAEYSVVAGPESPPMLMPAASDDDTIIVVSGGAYVDLDPEGEDSLTTNRPLLDGGFGNDTITGGDANEVILGGDGNDFLNGAKGNDTLSGGAGDDYINGSRGTDRELPETGTLESEVFAGTSPRFTHIAGNDYSFEEVFFDPSLVNTADLDVLLGNNGADTLVGGIGADIVDGGIGVDLIATFGGGEEFFGADTIVFDPSLSSGERATVLATRNNPSNSVDLVDDVFADSWDVLVAELPDSVAEILASGSPGKEIEASSSGWDGDGLGSASLTYYVGDVPNEFGLTQKQVESALAAAFEFWSQIVDVSFTQTSAQAQAGSLDVSFVDIDGRGGRQAGAYFPHDVNNDPLAGDIQFDRTESWEIGNGQGGDALDFILIAVHEIGHALGIGHLDEPDAVMRDNLTANDSFTGFSSADIAAARQIYAATSPVSLQHGVLTVIGSDQRDHVLFVQRRIRGEQQLIAKVNGTIHRFDANAVESIVVHTLGGNDVVRARSSVKVPLLVFAGAGDDRLIGGAADDLLIGGDGNDITRGRRGDDRLAQEGGIASIWGRDGNNLEFSGNWNDAFIRTLESHQIFVSVPNHQFVRFGELNHASDGIFNDQGKHANAIFDDPGLLLQAMQIASGESDAGDVSKADSWLSHPLSTDISSTMDGTSEV